MSIYRVGVGRALGSDSYRARNEACPLAFRVCAKAERSLRPKQHRRLAVNRELKVSPATNPLHFGGLNRSLRSSRG